MTDNLRDRIAAALIDSLCAEIDRLGQYCNRYTPLDDNGEPTSEWRLGIDGSVDVRAVADAVIAELGIRPEWGLLDHTDSGLICDSLEEAKSRKPLPGESLHTRLVTDWVDVPQG